MRGFDARGSWRAGRPPDLFDGRRQCRGGKFRLLWCAAGSGGDMQDFRAGMLVVGAGGPVALQTSSMGEDSAEAGNSDFCGARPGAGEICRLPRRVFRSWELEGRSPSRPLRWEKTVPRREIPTSVVRGRERGRYAGLPRGNVGRGSWRAGRPPDLLRP